MMTRTILSQWVLNRTINAFTWKTCRSLRVLILLILLVVLPAISYGQYWDLFYNNRVLSDETGRLIQSVTKWDTLRKADRKAIRTVKIIGGLRPMYGAFDSVLEVHSYNKQGVLTKSFTSEDMLSKYEPSCNDSFYKEAYTPQSNISYTDSVSWKDILITEWGHYQWNIMHLYEQIGFYVLWDSPSSTLLPIDSLLSLIGMSIDYNKRTENEDVKSHKLLGYYDSTHVLRRFEGTLAHIKVFGSTNRVGPSSYISCLYNKYVIEFDVSYYNKGIDKIVFSFPDYKESGSDRSEQSLKFLKFYTMDIYKKHESIKAILHVGEGLNNNTTGFYTVFFIPKPFVKGSQVRFTKKSLLALNNGIIKTTF